MSDYRWGLAKLDYEHPSDRTKRLSVPKIGLLLTQAVAQVWDKGAKEHKRVIITVPWTFSTRREARYAAVLHNKIWNFSGDIKIRVVKFYTTIQGDL